MYWYLLTLAGSVAGPLRGAYLADILTGNELMNDVGDFRLAGDAGATLAPLFLGRITP